MFPGFRLACVGAAACCLVLSLAAQDALRVDVRLVNVTATVTDTTGRYVNNLTFRDFIVEEDGVPQKITHFSQDHDVPVSVGILLDVSGSMDRKVKTATDAVEHFVRNIHEDDDVFLMTFADKPILRQDFTNDRQKISKALRSLRLTNGTAIYDALSAGIDKLREGRHDKRAILLITDGQDTSSRATVESLTKTIRGSELLVYSLGIGATTYADPVDHIPFNLPRPGAAGNRGLRGGQRDSVNMTALRQFADSSGGRATLLSETFIGGKSSQLDKVLSQIADELRSQYSLAYSPSNPDDGRFHNIRVKTRNGYIVRARNGYAALEN